MMTTRSRFFSSSSGSAASPSRSGISISRMTTSGLARGTRSTASRPVRTEATVLRSRSSSIQRETRPRTTTASSTIMTRMRSCAASGAAGARVAATLIRRYSGYAQRLETRRQKRGLIWACSYPKTGSHFSGSCLDQSDLLELGLDDLLVERLHDVLVGAGAERARDVGAVVVGRGGHDPRPVASGR